MAPKTRSDSDNSKKLNGITISPSLSVRDVVLIMAAVVSVVAAWGVYGTRLSLVESANVTLNKQHIELKTNFNREIGEIKEEIAKYKITNDVEHKEMRKDQSRFDREQFRRKAIVDKVEHDLINGK